MNTNVPFDLNATTQEAFQKLADGRQGLFKRLNLHNITNDIGDIAHKAASEAVENARKLAQQAGTTLSDDAAKAAATKAYNHAFTRAAHTQLAQKFGHASSLFVRMGHTVADSFSGVFGQLTGQGPLKPPGRVAKAVGWLPNKALTFMGNHRIMTAAGVTAAAAYGVASFLGGRKEAKAQNEYDQNMQQLAAMQQQTAMMEQQAAMMERRAGYGAPSYKNSVSPEEYAYMQSQMREGGQQGFAAAQEARRAAAAQQAGLASE